MIYDEITLSIHRSIIERMEEKIEWRAKQNYEQIYEYFLNEGITASTPLTTSATDENSTPTTTLGSEPDNASIVSWSLASLMLSLSFVIFAV